MKDDQGENGGNERIRQKKEEGGEQSKRNDFRIGKNIDR